MVGVCVTVGVEVFVGVGIMVDVEVLVGVRAMVDVAFGVGIGDGVRGGAWLFLAMKGRYRLEVGLGIVGVPSTLLSS